jgi:hypothetical protein
LIWAASLSAILSMLCLAVSLAIPRTEMVKYATTDPTDATRIAPTHKAMVNLIDFILRFLLIVRIEVDCHTPDMTSGKHAPQQ